MIHRHIIYTKFSQWRFQITKAEGSYIWDQNNRQIIDFTSGWNVTNLGWNHPGVIEAARKQLSKNTFAQLWFSDEIQEKYASALCHILPKELNSCSRVTGGAEANEHAMKLAKSYTGREKILGFIESYHGNNLSLLALGYRPEWLSAMTSNIYGVAQIEYPDLYRTDKNPTQVLDDFADNLEQILKTEEIAAVMAESGIISGWGSARVAPIGFLTVIRKLTEKYGTLLILDEVGTGFSRTGKLFGLEHEQVIPDIITMAKGISNGVLPMGAMITKSAIVEKGSDVANLQSTFGWLPASCAAALETIKLHQKEKLWEKAGRDGRYLLNTLRERLGKQERVGDIRGMGMLIGIDFVLDQKTKQKDPAMVEMVVKKAWERKLHLVSDHESVVQLMPPLTIEREVLDRGIDILVEVIKSLN